LPSDATTELERRGKILETTGVDIDRVSLGALIGIGLNKYGVNAHRPRTARDVYEGS
jgi:hypothetical protein